MTDYFEVFELPRKLRVDEAALRRRFYELSRQHHPDFHQLSGAAAQATALGQSALVNRAYRALRDPIPRVEYLIALEEGRDGAGAPPIKPVAPRDLLEEMLELQEALEEAKRTGIDEAARERLLGERQRLIERRTAIERDIVARGADWDAAIDHGTDRAPLLAWFKQALATRAYLRTVIDDLSQALGEDQDAHVSHRRH
jgi:molecular chaperone HscB